MHVRRSRKNDELPRAEVPDLSDDSGSDVVNVDGCAENNRKDDARPEEGAHNGDRNESSSALNKAPLETPYTTGDDAQPFAQLPEYLFDLANWAFGPLGLPKLRILAYGDFSHHGRYAEHTVLLCRNVSPLEFGSCKTPAR